MKAVAITLIFCLVALVGCTAESDTTSSSSSVPESSSISEASSASLLESSEPLIDLPDPSSSEPTLSPPQSTAVPSVDPMTFVGRWECVTLDEQYYMWFDFQDNGSVYYLFAFYGSDVGIDYGGSFYINKSVVGVILDHTCDRFTKHLELTDFFCACTHGNNIRYTTTR